MNWLLLCFYVHSAISKQKPTFPFRNSEMRMETMKMGAIQKGIDITTFFPVLHFAVSIYNDKLATWFAISTTLIVYLEFLVYKVSDKYSNVTISF